MYFEITKGELRIFLKTFFKDGVILDVDKKLENTIYELGGYCSTYFLHDKPDSHILNEWQFKECFYMIESNPLDKNKYINIIDLDYFFTYKRDKKIEDILEWI